MPKKPADKLAHKRQLLIQRTAACLQVSEQQAAELLRTPRQQSVRVNCLKTSVGTALEALKELGWQGEAYHWLSDGYTVAAGMDAIRDSALVAGGEVFIQNAASWLPVLALNPQPTDRILDMCAAPGGKTSHIASLANNQAIITANDNSRPRLAKLQANMQRLGVNIDHYTLLDATNIARKLGGEQFSKILLDAPCSGEGLMHLDHDKDFASWSVAHIKRLQQLQKRLITQAWQLLEPGGTLVYSTCTMAPEENEAVVDYLLRKHEDTTLLPYHMDLPNTVQPVQTWNSRGFTHDLSGCLRLAPSRQIEAFFVAKLLKT